MKCWLTWKQMQIDFKIRIMSNYNTPLYEVMRPHKVFYFSNVCVCGCVRGSEDKQQAKEKLVLFHTSVQRLSAA